MKKVTFISIEAAISGDRNVKKKEAEKVLKCKDRTMQIQRFWNVINKSDTSNNMGR
jgi:phosphopantetheine adenylyltransferase